jgi:Ca2+/Na+ antiporter
VRAGLVLTATGIVSAASERHAYDLGTDIVFAYGFLLYLALLLIAVPRRPWRFAPLAALAAFATIYLSAAVTSARIDALGLSLYVIAGALAYLVSPPRFRALTVAAFAMWTPALRLFGPDPFLGAYPLSGAVASVLALVFLVLMLLLRRRVDDDERVRRIGLGLLAVACVARISERHLVVATVGGVAPDDLWALVVVVILPLVALLKLRRSLRDAVATGVAIGTYLLVAVALVLGKGYHVDTVAVEHRAAEIVARGGNPYVEIDIPTVLRSFGLDPALATNFEDGSEVRSFNYPALSFLVPAPFIAAGLRDIRFVYVAEIFVFVLVLLGRVRLPWRPLIAAAVVGNTVIASQNVLAGVDPLWAILTGFGFLFIARRHASPILLGLACAARQPAWFFVPFYLVAAWRRDGRREALRRAAIVAIAGAVPNLPFFLADPGAFLGGVLAPMLGPLEPYGVGLIRFSMDGILPLLPRGVYSALSAIVFVVLLGALWRWWRRIPSGAVVFPSVILWFAWRSLQNYFAFAGLFALIGDETIGTSDGERTIPDSPS